MKGFENDGQQQGWSPPMQPMQKPGFARMVSVGRLLASTSVIGVLAIGALQSVMPEGNKPADWFGAFYGGIESAEAKAKRDERVELDRRVAQEVAREQAKTQMEIIVLQNQMDTLKESLQMRTATANFADAFCTLGSIIPGDASNNDVRNAGRYLRGACGQSDAIRADMQRQYVLMARQHAALIARSDELHLQEVKLRERLRLAK